MRDCKREIEARVAFVKKVLAQAGAKGIVYGNSGGKDCTLVGILCKMACPNTLGVMLPCQSRRNYEVDTRDALAVAEQYGIEQRTVDLGAVKDAVLAALDGAVELGDMASANIAPRLRMTALYAIAQSRGALVAGTGNRSEGYMGYFTKWGDGAYDFNPIADLTVGEIYQLLEYLGAPRAIIDKAPSAGLFEGQTDEAEMGLTYRELDAYLLEGRAEPAVRERIERFHAASEHKRRMPLTYPADA